MKKFKISFFTFVLILTSSIQLPINAASDHQNGQIRVRWSTSEMYLNQNNYIEQEFTPLATTSFKDGEPFRWSNQYHFDFWCVLDCRASHSTLAARRQLPTEQRAPKALQVIARTSCRTSTTQPVQMKGRPNTYLSSLLIKRLLSRLQRHLLQPAQARQ